MMKSILVIMTLMTFYNFQETTFNPESALNNLNDQIETEMNAEQQRQYQIDLGAYQRSIQAAVNNHLKETKTVEIGQFSILVQSSCELDLTHIKEPENPTTIERDCYNAEMNAESTAELLIKATPEDPVNPALVINATNSCDLRVGWVKTFSIFDECWNGALPETYQAMYNDFVNNMQNNHGWQVDTSVVDGKNVTTFKKTGEEQVINLEQFQNQTNLLSSG